MRRCGRCGQLRPVEEFAWRRKRKGQRHNCCRHCHAAYHREHYLANRARYIAFKGHPCVDCGETDPLVLEFDHLRDKSFEVAAKLVDYGWERILAEIEKCEVVCANCHRRRTVRRRGSIRVLLSEDGAF